MKQTIILEGVKLDIKPKEQDGKILFKQKNEGIIPINNPTELGETLKELNKDEIDYESRMSGIDMRARLYPSEISSILALDALVAFGICPTRSLAFTRQKKRLSVSQMGLGRKEIVDIVGGKRELETRSSTGFWDTIKGKFQRKNE